MHDFDPGLLPYPLPFTLGHENTRIVESVALASSTWPAVSPWPLYGP